MVAFSRIVLWLVLDNLGMISLVMLDFSQFAKGFDIKLILFQRYHPKISTLLHTSSGHSTVLSQMVAFSRTVLWLVLDNSGMISLVMLDFSQFAKGFDIRFDEQIKMKRPSLNSLNTLLNPIPTGVVPGGTNNIRWFIFHSLLVSLVSLVIRFPGFL